MLLLALFACTEPTDTGKPADDTDVPDTDTDGDTDTDTAPPDENEAPGAVEIAITPSTPPVGVDFTVTIVNEAVDPDGDAVTYRYAWTVDGVDAGIDGATVLGTGAALGQRWEVTVTPTDGELDGTPATAAAVIGNSPPSMPGLALSPLEPEDGDDITLTIDPPSVDPDGDPVTTTITWYQNDSWVPWFDNLTTIDGAYVGWPDTFRAVVSVTDGFNDPVVAEVSVTLAYSCSNPPPEHLGDTTMPDARAYHGVAFDDDGNLLGYDGRGSIVKSTYDGDREVFVPGVGTIQQIDRFPDGTWVYADNSRSALMRLDETGGTEVISTGVGSAYGVVVGPDEKVWVANNVSVLRVDPDTGVVETILASTGGGSPHTIEFNLDSTALYIGVIGSTNIYQLALDANLDPVGSATVFASAPGTGWHDGLGVDTCGNVYLADYSSRGLYRISADGSEVTNMVGNDPTAYGHGLQWGNGIGGWRTDTLYQPQPYNGNTVREVVIGFESGDTVRTWNGVAVPW